jgi:phosphotransferase system HPr (HPr) family protein
MSEGTRTGRHWWSFDHWRVCRCVQRFASGFRAVDAADLAKTAAPFDAKISVHKEGAHVDGKDVVGLLTLAVGPGETVEIVARGAQARDAMRAIKAVFATEQRDDDVRELESVCPGRRKTGEEAFHGNAAAIRR